MSPPAVTPRRPRHQHDKDPGRLSMSDSGAIIREIAFEMAASSIRFGAGVTREVGMDLADLGVRRALIVTDSSLARLPPVSTVLTALDGSGVQAVLYDRVRVEPTDMSFREAI